MAREHGGVIRPSELLEHPKGRVAIDTLHQYLSVRQGLAAILANSIYHTLIGRS